MEYTTFRNVACCHPSTGFLYYRVPNSEDPLLQRPNPQITKWNDIDFQSVSVSEAPKCDTVIRNRTFVIHHPYITNIAHFFHDAVGGLWAQLLHAYGSGDDILANRDLWCGSAEKFSLCWDLLHRHLNYTMGSMMA
jgi:hypothetical protein